MRVLGSAQCSLLLPGIIILFERKLHLELLYKIFTSVLRRVEKIRICLISFHFHNLFMLNIIIGTGTRDVATSLFGSGSATLV
jgi:hypothetical protein